VHERAIAYAAVSGLGEGCTLGMHTEGGRCGAGQSPRLGRATGIHMQLDICMGKGSRGRRTHVVDHVALMSQAGARDRARTRAAAREGPGALGGVL
jgi:hypothetical protein